MNATSAATAGAVIFLWLGTRDVFPTVDDDWRRTESPHSMRP
jgi:hypothetical protein